MMNSKHSTARLKLAVNACLATAILAWLPASLAAEPPVFQAQVLEQFDTFDARQGVAVDAGHFYAVNNFRITRHDLSTGEPQLQWDGISDVNGPLIHLDSGMVLNGRLYAAHSNYPHWPMTSSIEMWDTVTMEHAGSFSFGISTGSMTWVDHYEGYWWAGFGNYDKVQPGQDHPYGETRSTQIVQMDSTFSILRRWTLPEHILERMAPMSNSGGSWGPDGYLYLTDHDYPEIYVMQLPATGSELTWVATVQVPGLNGQGIAWERSADNRILWGILKQDRLVYRIEMPDIELEQNSGRHVRQPGQFVRD